MGKRLKCVDPRAGSKIPLEIIFPISAGEKSAPHDLAQQPELSIESRRHLEACESCRSDLSENLEMWYKKGIAGRKSAQAYAIVHAAEGGDPTILRRSITGGTAFFKPIGDDKGLLVLLTHDHYINDPEEKTLEEFSRMC